MPLDYPELKAPTLFIPLKQQPTYLLFTFENGILCPLDIGTESSC